ncbi:uncharacterized protein N7458_008206 [Penicillium daleae]|uniref:HIT-type domain-containing protein n=1 Tax=Penicillium daleae TaxID=63821 RepID=A0AAD6C2M8_9EURO|nr:uncharacterized protein N7458_008206 [Penicillium daleae]KAJ5444334.1 hypothetical protein N7458_008206 [Penicillium daleae]
MFSYEVETSSPDTLVPSPRNPSNRVRLSCSLACTQSHKIYCAPKATPPNEEPKGTPAADATPTPTQNGDSTLETAGNTASKKNQTSAAAIAASPELQTLLSRYPQLRNQLHEIYQATEEEEWQEWYTPPTRGRPYGRGGRGPSRRSRGSWTAEKGFNRGLGKVRKLRQDCEGGTEIGVQAEAFTEFLAMVNKDRQAQSQLPE